MKIVTTRVQRFGFYIAALITILASAIIFNNGWIMLAVFPVAALTWKLVDWGIEYQDMETAK